MVLLAGEEPYIEPYGWYRLPTGAMYNVQYVLATVPLTSLINIYKLYTVRLNKKVTSELRGIHIYLCKLCGSFY